jgi:signal transduction histidine kinase
MHRTFQPLAEQKKLALTFTVDRAVPASFPTDPLRLQQILRNLLANAIKFTEHGEVSLRVSMAEEGRLAFSVRDTGVGIPAEQHETIFEAFRQADGSTHRKYGGSGLGLTISRELARRLGGTLSLVSELGKGSTFTLVLPPAPDTGVSQEGHSDKPETPAPRPHVVLSRPAVSTGEQPKVADARETVAPGERTILVIEDDERFAAILRDLAHELHFRSLVATRAAEGLHLAEQFVPSAIILDVHLPDLSGLSLLEQLKRNDLLDVTRITRNKVRLHKETLELNEIVRRTAEDNRSLFERSHVDLQVDLAREPIMVSADRTRLAQVISNLLQNAAKFTPSGGHTRIAVEADGDQVLVRVADDGVGMAPSTLERLFQPFAQAAQAIDRSGGGLGLGLALVKGLVELHGGQVSAHSDGLGKGSQFVLEIPRRPGVSAQKARVTGPLSFQTRRVLIIEDNHDAAESLREVLEFDNHQVAVAHDGVQGLRTALEFRPDVVLCDIGLPGMDGYEVARALRADEQLGHLYLVALTGYALPEDLARAQEAGFQDHLAKPPSIERLVEILSRVPGGPVPHDSVTSRVSRGFSA